MRHSPVGQEYLSSTLLVFVLLLFLLSEAMLILAFNIFAKGRASSLEIAFIANVVITCVPCVAGMRGYRAAKRLQMADMEGQEHAISSLSRQFLLATIAGYAAVITSIVLLTNILRPR